MAHYRSGNQNPDGSWEYDLESYLQQQFSDRYFNRHNSVNHRNNIIKRFQDRNCICKGKCTGRRTKLMHTTMADIQHRMIVSPKKSLRRLSAQSSLILSINPVKGNFISIRIK